MNININSEHRHCTFSFFDEDVEYMLLDSGDKLEDFELELLVVKLWNMQKTMIDVVGMELAQA
jgi:hypothetical protein|tara:strand:+ start:564 stop:752 length:189 start_codon:yes stop_codon:yes gene_type:complete